MLVATSLNVLYDYTNEIDRAVDRLSAAGFEALDFNGCDMMSLWPGKDGEERVERLRIAAEKHRLPWLQAHGPMFSYWGDDAPQQLEETKRCIRWCGQLGVPWMVMHTGTRPGAWDAAHHQANLQANLDFFRPFFELLAEHQVGIAIENTADMFNGRAYGSTPEDLCELHDALDCEWIGLCWDTGHALLQKLPQREAIGSLGSRLKAIHVQDNDGRADHHLLPYTGRVDWEGVIGGLQDCGYAGAFTYETHNAVRHLPDPLRDSSLRLMVDIGHWFVSRIAGAA